MRPMKQKSNRKELASDSDGGCGDCGGSSSGDSDSSDSDEEEGITKSSNVDIDQT